jgi:superfamily II DNA or RNA helicase
MGRKVLIRRSGNVLEVTPEDASLTKTMLCILGPELTYTHRTENTEWYVRGKSQSSYHDRELFRLDGNSLLTTQGAFRLITRALDGAGWEWEYQDLRTKQTLQPNWEHLKSCMPNLQFRLKQNEVLAYLIGENSGQIVAPTAYGKTFLMMAFAALYPDAHIIITSPSRAMLSSGYRRIQEITADVGRVGGGYNEPRRITMCTLRSLLKAPVDKCDVLLVDEVHKVASPHASDAVARVRNAVKVFGMTATPEGRADGADLVAEVLLGPRVYEITYEEAADAGIVSKLKVALFSLTRDQQPHVISQDYSGRTARKRHGYWRNQPRNEAFAWAMENVPGMLGMRGDLQKLILVEVVEHALRLRKLLPHYEIVYGSLSKIQREKFIAAKLLPPDYKSLTDKRREIMLRDFERGDLRRVIATGCWGEGVDFVHLDVLGNASGSPSPINVVQWSGRDSRVHEGKEFGLLIDSADEWDPWASRRASSRRTIYRRKKWEIIKVNDLIRQAQRAQQTQLPLG